MRGVSTEQFLFAPRRFSSFYGHRHLLADSAKPFRPAEVCLKRQWQAVLQSGSVRSLCGASGVSWTFITQRAPGNGGFYERLVHETTIATGGGEHTSGQNLVVKWRQFQDFWTKWQRTYLTSLREHAGTKDQRGVDTREPAVGLGVLVRDNCSRGTWKLCRIESLLSSAYRRVRFAVVKMGNGRRLRRQIKLMCPQEMRSTGEDQVAPQTTDEAGGRRREQRPAAAVSRRRTAQ